MGPEMNTSQVHLDFRYVPMYQEPQDMCSQSMEDSGKAGGVPVPGVTWQVPQRLSQQGQHCYLYMEYFK